MALPVNGSVAGGNAVISSPSSTVTQINQSSNRAVIDWHSYNINRGETVRYQQPNSSSITLNRIDPAQGVSKIYGSIQANGQVWLTNSAGIWFAPGSYVNVSGLLATTSSIKADDFMAGNYHFQDSSSYEGSIVNEGTIIVKNHGLAALVGSNVTNTGLIVANQGTVVLGASKKFTVDFYGDQLVNFEVGGEVANPKVNQSGKIIANGGKVVMTAKTASRVLDDTISMKGVVVAKSVYQRNGEIILDGGQGGVTISGKLIASGKYQNQKGGTVKVYARKVKVQNTSVIDVSGDVGGGKVLFNAMGDEGGVVIDSNARVDASALSKGQGGTIDINASNEISVSGQLYAKGGYENGQGGNVLIDSGANGTTYSFADINVSSSFANGKGGIVKLLGKNVGLMSGSIINASGDIGGGEVLVGGNAHGAGPELNAKAVYMDQNAYIYSNALSIGYGGRVVLWSDEVTNFYGNIYAQGGALGGNGGWVETSGKDYLGSFGNVSASAANGLAGSWLLDPRNVTITTVTSGGSFSGGNPNTFTPIADNATVNVTTINNALNAGTSVTITTSGTTGTQNGDITVNSNISKTAGGDATLTLNAASNGLITINNPITATIGTLNVDLNGGLQNSGGIIINAAITSHGGDVTLTSFGNSINANIITSGGLFNAISNGGTTLVNNNVTINSGAGNLAITGSGVSLGANARLLTSAILNIAVSAINPANIDSTSQIGGTGVNSGFSTSVILQTNTGGFVTYGVGSASGSGAIRLPQSLLNQVRSQILTIGGAGNSSDITIGTLTQPTNVTSSLIFRTSDNVTIIGDVTLSVPLEIGSGLFSGGSTVALNSGVTINTGGNDLSIYIGGTGFTGGALTLASNAQLLSTGTILLRTETITTTATSQIGGNGTGTGNADTIILYTSNPDRNYSVNSTTAAGLGTETLILTPTTLNILRTKNLRIGNSNIFGGNMVITAWTPGTNYVFTGTLSLNAGGNITQTGGGLVLGSSGTNLPRLMFRAGGNVTLTNANNDIGLISGIAGGNFSLTNTSGTPIAIRTFTDDAGTTTGLNVSALTLTTSGAGASITQNSPIVATSGILTSDAAITLNNTSNNFTGNVRFTTTGASAVSLFDSNSLSLGLSNVGTGTVTLTANNGNIVFNNAFTTSGNMVLIANGGSISDGTAGIINTNILTTTSDTGVNLNNGHLINTYNGTNTTSGGIVLVNADDLALNNVTLNSNGFLDVTVNGAGNALTLTGLLQAGANGVTGVSLATTGGGSITELVGGSIRQNFGFFFANTAGGGNILLNQTDNEWNGSNIAVSAVVGGTGNISIADITALKLGLISTGSGAITLQAGLNGTSGNFITQTTGAGTGIIQGGGGLVSFINISPAGDITLNNTLNSWIGAVRISSLNNATIYNSNGITFTNAASTSVGGNLQVTANAGSITQNAGGVLAISGTSSFTANSGGISLTSTANDFIGAVSLFNSGNSNNVSIRDANSIILGASSVGTGALNVTASGSITQTGGITQQNSAGAATFTTGNDVITLTNAGNNFTGAVSLNNSGANNVAVTDSNAIILGASSIGSGTLTINAIGITQSGSIVQAASAGIATFNAGAGVIALDDSGNDFTGAVRLLNSGANNVILTDSNALILGSSAVGSGTLTVNGAGISQTGAITQASSAGAATFNSGFGTLNLTNVANNFTGAVSLNTMGSANASILDNAGGLILGDSTLAANLTITVNGTGSLTQLASTALTVPGTLTITNGTGAITLNNSGNLLTTLGTITGGELTLNDSADGLSINGAITTTGATISTVGLLSLTATGDITTSAGNISLTGTGITQVTGSDVNAGSGTITYDASAAAMNLNGGTITTTNATSNAINLIDAAIISIGNSITATASGAILNLGISGAPILGGVTQTTPLNVNGLSGRTTGTITLTNAGNSITNLVSFTSGAFTLVNNRSLTNTGAVITSGAINITTGLTTGVGFAQTAGGSFNTNNNNFTLNAGGGSVNFLGSLTASAITMNNATTVGLGTLTGSSLNIISAGSISDNGVLPVIVSGQTTLAPGAANMITLDNAANNFGTILFTNGLGATITDVNGIVIGPTLSTLGANGLSITAGGAITQSGIINAGNLSINNTVADTTLILNNIIGTLSTISAAGRTFSFTTTVALTQSNGMTVANLILTNTSGSTSLTNTSNQISNLGNINATGQLFDLFNTVALSQLNNTSLLAGNARFQGSAAISLGQGIGQTNAITGSLAANITGGNAFSYRNNSSSISTLSIGTVNGTNGITTTGAGNINLTNSNGNLVIGGNLTAGTTGNINLVATSSSPASSGSITGASLLTGNALTTSSTAGTSLTNNSNNIVTFNGTNTNSGNISFVNGRTAGLTVSGITQTATGGDVSIYNRGTGALNITGVIDPDVLVLFSNGVITDSSQIIANSLITQSVGGTTIDASNNIIGNYSGLNTGGGNILVRNNDAANFNIVTYAGDGGSVGAIAGISNSGAGRVIVQSLNSRIILGSGASITSGGIASASSASILLVNGLGFTNSSGSTTPFVLTNGSGGNFQIWGVNRSNDVLNNLSGYSFIQYANTYPTYPTITASGLPVASGVQSGMIYSEAPTASLSLTGAIVKQYDGNATATVNTATNYSASGAINGDLLTFGAPSSANYPSKNVGTGLLVTATGITLTATDSTGSRIVYGYSFNGSASGSVGEITPATLTVNGITANTRTYDATTGATLNNTGSLSGVVGADNVTLNSASLTANFIDKNVGVNKIVNVTGYSLSGTDAGNYTLVSPQTGLGTITAASLTLSGLTVSNKVYNASTTATVTAPGTLNGVFGGDTVNLNSSSLTANFIDKNVGTGKLVNVTGYGLTGADAANYTLASPQTTTANITPATLSVSGITANTRTYDATTSATLNNYGSLSGVFGGDSVSLNSSSLTANFIDKNVGVNKTVNVTGYGISGTDAGNYILASPQTGQGTITAASLVVNGITANSKVYDATTTATVSNAGSLGGVLGSDSVTLNSSSLTANFIDKNVANGKTVNVTGYAITGTDAGNYVLASPQTTTANITPATLTVSGITANSKVYNTTTTATLSSTGSLSGVLGSDSVTLNSSALTANFVDKNVGTNKTVNVTGYGISGTDAGNYILGSPQTGLGNITPATVIVNGITANTRVYNATTTATLSSTGTLSGVLGSDSVTLNSSSLTANFNNKNVGVNKTVNVTGYSLNGTDAGNYSLASPQTGLGTITPASLTVTGITANTKVYDATTAATLSNTGSLNGLQGSDSVTLNSGSLTANFNNKNVGTNKPVNVTGYSITGTDASNYTFSTSQSGLGNITPVTLIVNGISANSRVYNGTTSATLSSAGTLGGVIGSDNVTLNSGSLTANFTDKNVGTNKTVNVTGYSLNGTDAGNYILASPQTTTANITAATLIVNGITANTKVYDTTTAATLSNAGTLSGVIGGDSVTLDSSSLNANFINKNAGVNKTVNVTGYGLTGADAGNYTLVSPQTGSGTITQAALTVNGITANSKVYDATTTASLSSAGTLNGVLGADSVTLNSSSLTANFVDKNVGTNKNVNVTGYSLSGGDAANYSLASPQVGQGNITPAPLNVTGVSAQNKTYDATVNAAITGSAALSGIQGSDNVTISSAPTTGTFADKNVGNGKTVTADSAYVISGIDSGNYTLSQPSFTANITPATITISNVTANDKVYDGTTAATINTGSINYTGILPADAGNVTVNGTATGEFATKNVGNNIQITFSGLSLTGSEAGNYVLGNSSSTTTANITPKPITISGVQANSKNYDGTVIATFNNAGALVGTIGGDDVSAPNAVSVLGNFDTKNVGTGKTVTVITYNLSGADAGNYSVTMPTTTADINAADLTLTPGGTSVYGDGHVFNGTEFSQTGLASGESLTVSFNLGSIAPGANVNSYALTINPGSEVAGSGTDLSNYNIILNAGIWVVTPRPITITGITVTAKQYDATTNVSSGQINTAGYSISNIYAPDLGNVTIDPTNTTASYVDANVGANKTVNLFNITLGGSAASNYTLENPPSTALSSITPAPLTINPNAGQGKVYGQADPSPLSYGVSGLQGSDTQSVVTGLLARAAGENASSYAYSIAGLSASNYTLSLDSTNSFVITPAPLTLIANDASKVYGTTKTYTGTEFTVSGGTPLQFSDSIASVSLSSTGDVSTANVAGSPYAILINNAIGGGSTNLNNYSINYQSGNLTVTPASLSVTGITAQTKIYDGNTTATLSNAGTLNGVIGSDSVNLVTSGLTANFNDKNVGLGKLVNITGYSITGSEAGNYVISSSQIGSGDISPATLTVTGITAIPKTYDATTTATLNSVGSLNGVVGGDSVILDSSSLTAAFSDKNAGVNKVVNVNGYSVSGDTSNYVFSSTQSGLGTITPLTITVDGITANTKTYNGTTTATLSSVGSLNGVLSGDSVSLNSSSLTANFDDKNVGIGKNVLVTGYSLSGTDGGNYSLISPQVGSGDITAASLSVNNITANTKVYDTTTTATLSSVGSLSGLASGDSVNLDTSSLVANFDDKNVGTNKSLTVTGYGISGTDAGNYIFSSTQSGTGDITPASLTVSGIDAGSRVYNGTTNASLVSSGSLTGVLGSDSVTLNSSGVTANFIDKNVGNNKVVNANGYSISGIDASNYTFSSAQTGTGTITAAPLTISGLTGNNKVYDSTTSATLASAGSLSGKVSGDDVNLSTSSVTAAFLDKNVGNGKTINVNGYSISGADINNYTFSTSQTTTGNITPATLTVTGIVADSKTYNATTTANISSAGNLSGVFGGDNIIFDTSSVVGNFVDKNVANGKVVNVTGYGITGTDAGNYLLPSPQTTTANITPATLNVTGIVVNDKTYNGNTSATINNPGSLNGVFGGDNVTFNSSSVVGNFIDKNVGSNKTVNLTGYSISGVDSGNYILPSPQTTAANITPATLNVTGITANTKVYDSTTAATLNANGSLNGLIGGDNVTLDTSSLSAAFIDKNVGLNKVVNVSGYGISGADASNYSFSSSQTGTGTITPASLSVTGITANTKVYDTTTAATLSSVGALNGVLGSDNVSLNSSSLISNFNNKNVGIGKPVNVTGYSISGTDAGNYTFTTAQSGTGTITPATLTVANINADSRVYNGNTLATLTTTGNLSGVLGSDVVNLNSTSLTANFVDKNVANNKTVNVNGYTISGADANNYALSSLQTTQADITPASLTISSGVSANNKVYDGSTNAALNVGSVAFNGLIGSDVVTLDSSSATGSFDDKNVGNAKPVTTSGLALTGTDGGNYLLIQPTLFANISPLTVTVSNVTANNKVYDGTTVATLNVGTAAISGAVGGDNVNLVTGSAIGSFSDKNVGTNKSVTGSNFELGGQDAGNYILTQPSYMTADITVATINPDMTNNPTKIYDKTTTVTSPITVDPNIISGDDVTVNWAAANYDDFNVGASKVITLSGISLSGTDAGNYVLGGITILGQGSITPRPLSNISATAASRTYDGTSIATPTVTSALGAGNNVIAGDVVQLDITNATGTFVTNLGVADPNAGVNKLVYINNLSITGADASNYILPSPNAQTTATIFQAPLTISATTVDKVYDGTNVAPSNPIQSIDPLFGSDTLAGPITQFYSDKNVGNGKTITPSTITILDGNGNVSNNYAISYITATGNITPATLNIVGGAANNKIYDANTTATLSNKGSLTGVVSGDNVTFNNTNVTGTFANSNVANGIIVTLAGYVLGGSDLSNYTINLNPTSTANITPAPLTITANGTNKVYDANAFTGGNGLTYSGFVGGEDSSVLSGSVVYGGSSQSAINVGAYDISASGLSSGNYAISFVNGTLNVTPAPIIIVGINGVNKVYNASTIANLDSSSFNYSGIIGTDVVNVNGSNISGNFINKNVGVNKAIILSGVTLSGADASNYQVVYSPVTANITPATLNTQGITAKDKYYDGNTSVQLNFNNARLNGVYAGDQISINTASYNAYFSEAGPAMNIEVYVGGLSLLGPDAINYQLVDPSNLHASILPATAPGPLPAPVDVSAGIIFPNWYLGTDASLIGLDGPENTKNENISINCSNLDKVSGSTICSNQSNAKKVLWTSIKLNEAIISPSDFAGLRPNQTYLPQ